MDHRSWILGMIERCFGFRTKRVISFIIRDGITLGKAILDEEVPLLQSYNFFRNRTLHYCILYYRHTLRSRYRAQNGDLNGYNN